MSPRPDVRADLETDEVGGITVNQAFLLGTTVYAAIPLNTGTRGRTSVIMTSSGTHHEPFMSPHAKGSTPAPGAVPTWVGRTRSSAPYRPTMAAVPTCGG
jgi:hypothetical protein